MTLALTRDQEVALKRAALNGDYHLLLGAGASHHSVDRNGERLPTADGLAALLAKNFDVPLEEGDLLWRVYARAVEKEGEATVYSWLRIRFWDVTPPSWMDVLARTPWGTVWTLNIDDTFERAYDRVKSETSRRLFTINWDDEFRFDRNLAVVHLHGCVDRDLTRRLVFSLSEYASTAATGATWPSTFRDIYGISPFVIIGSRLRDEPDVEAIVSRRRPAHEAPSFYVNPHISPATEADMKNWNLVPLKMTGEEFAAIWPDLTGMSLSEAPDRDEIAFRIGRQFDELRTDVASPRKPPKGHDFIGGDEPIWEDIQGNRYAELDWIRRAHSDCSILGQNAPVASAIVYVGRRLTGRSTGLLAIGRKLRSLSWRTYLFVGDERPDTEAILRFASDGKAVALLFDSIADIAEDVDLLLRNARRSGLSVVCVAVDNGDKVANILGRLEEAYLLHRRIGTINPKLTRTDASRLVDKLESIGRLGVLEQLPDLRRVKHFRGRELFDSMAEVENAPGFGRRVGELVNAIESSVQLGIVFLVALGAQVGRRVLAIDAARMVGIESDALVRMIREDAAIAAVLSTDGRWVRTRHRWLACRPCIEKLGQAAALELLGEAMRRVAVRLSGASHRERNATSMLVGSFMTYGNIAKIFPSADLDSWYESLASSFGGWSARYWEQRAIMGRVLGSTRPKMLSGAESFASRAVNIMRDAYSLTTLGTVLLVKAVHGPVSEMDKYYDRAISAFEEASEDDPSDLVTWHAFLQHSIGVLERVHGKGVSLNMSLENRVNEDWLRIHANVAAVLNSNEVAKMELAALMRRYKKAASTGKV